MDTVHGRCPLVLFRYDPWVLLMDNNMLCWTHCKFTWRPLSLAPTKPNTLHINLSSAYKDAVLSAAKSHAEPVKSLRLFAANAFLPAARPRRAMLPASSPNDLQMTTACATSAAAENYSLRAKAYFIGHSTASALAVKPTS